MGGGHGCPWEGLRGGRDGLSGGRGRRGRGILNPLQPSLRQRLPDAAHMRTQHASKIISNATFNQPTLKIFIFITQIFIFATESAAKEEFKPPLCLLSAFVSKYNRNLTSRYFHLLDSLTCIPFQCRTANLCHLCGFPWL